MGSFSLSGGVEVVGFISPTNPLDTYPVIDPLYGIDGFRNVNLLSDLNTIPELRRRAGMVVGVSGGTDYYKLLPNPWNYTISDWGLFQTGGGSTVFTGGTVSGDTIFTQGLSANTFSATTYLGLPLDVYVTGLTFNTSNYDITIGRNDGVTFTDSLSILATDLTVTGGTYNPLNGTATFTNNTGGTFNVTGFTDIQVTGYTYQDNTFTIFDSSGNTFSATIDVVTGLTVNGTISATTYQNLPQDIFVTGGTYTNGEILFRNNSGSYFTVTGLPIGGAGGQVYYLNLSQTQTPYKEFSPIGTNLTEQTTGVTINSGVTSTIASFLTPFGYPNATTIPAGYWSFYIHSYKDVVNASFDVFCEVYTYTTGGTETLILTTEGADVTTYSPTVSMELTDGYYSGSTIDITDRILVKVRTTNNGSQTNTLTFFTEGQQHYSYGITPFSNFNALTCETLSGCTTIVNLENNKVNKGGDTMTGTLYVPTISANTISATTIGSSGDCVDDIYVSNIHSCSPLNINPLDEGNVYFGSTSGVTIDLSNKRIGIGTSTPVAPIEIYSNQPNVAIPNQIKFSQSGGNIKFAAYDATISDFFGITLSTNYNQRPVRVAGSSGLYVGSTTAVPTPAGYILVEGNVGIGLSGTTSKLHINNTTSGNTFLAEDSTNPDSSPFVIDASGNTGIGTTTPSEKLDVSGKTKTINLQVTSGATNGYVLTSDSSGNATWQSVPTFTGGTVNGLTATTISATTLNVNGVNITGDTYVTGGTYYTGGTIIFDYNTGGDFPVTGLTEDLNNAIDGLAEADELTIELEITTNKIRLKDIVAAGSGGTRTLQGDIIVESGLTATTAFIIYTQWTLDFMDSSDLEIYAPNDISIDSIINLVNSPTTIILVNNSPYTPTTLITSGDKINVTTDINSVIQFNITNYL